MINRYTMIWYKGEHRLAVLEVKYKNALARATLPRKATLITKAYERTKARIENERLEALKSLKS